MKLFGFALAIGLGFLSSSAFAQAPMTMFCGASPQTAKGCGFPTPNGYCQLSSLATAMGLGACTGGIPTGSTWALIEPNASGQAVRWRDDGTAPTASVGQELTAGTTLSYGASLSAVQFIQESSSATLNVTFYK